MAAFATAGPVIPAKITLDTILTWDRYPGNLPTIKLAKFYCAMREFFLPLSRKVASSGKNQTIMVNVPSMALMGRTKNRAKFHSDLIMLIMKFCSRKRGPSGPDASVPSGGACLRCCRCSPASFPSQKGQTPGAASPAVSGPRAAIPAGGRKTAFPTIQTAPIFFRMSSRSAFFNILPTGFRGMAATTSRRSGIL